MRKKTLQSRQFIIHLLTVFFALLTIEILFNLMSFNSIISTGFVRIILFNTMYALIISLLASFIPYKYSKWLVFIILLFISAYGITQLGFKSFMGNYMSFNQTADGAQRVLNYVVEFIKFLKIQYYSLLLPLVVVLFINVKSKLKHYYLSSKYLIIIIICTILTYSLLHISLNIFDSKTNLTNLFIKPNNIELALKEFGVSGFLNRDFMSFIFKPEINEEIVIQTPSSTPSLPIEENDQHRTIDDTLWNQQIDKETNVTISNVDQFLKSKTIDDYNEYSGYFEGKNLVYIMIEAFDYMAIDAELTPTLNKFKNEGWFFSNYYTPKYSCTTGESEYIGLVSLVPEADSCAPNDFMSNTYPQSIFNLFNNKGYSTSSYHNWKDQFYERRTLHTNMGSNNYYNYDDLQLTLKSGWPSDWELLEQSYNIYSKNTPFMSFIVTSSTHFPYDESSWLGDKYIDTINTIHPDYPIEVKRYLSKAMELDNGLKTILDSFERDGTLDDTVFVVFADHHPLKTDFNIINDYSDTPFSRLDYNYAFMDRTPFMIYNSASEAKVFDNVMSTFDIAPTLANLFNLEYDPRYYVGSDYFSSSKKIAIFTNGDWIVDEGIFSMINDRFKPFNEDITLSEDEISKIDTYVSNLMKSSWMIMNNDYFKDRNFKVRYQSSEN